ncbi:hypothetical protein AX17_003140 [Amanita inopinata Kibby_2008]|nr:hypothetical protein AX17_003140 [Amanita inopinata Kibby_2008]
MSTNEVGSSSPIQELPAELLTKIFIHSIFECEWTMEPIGIMRRRTCYPTPLPFLLSHVCSSWRTIILSTQQLWALVKMPSDQGFLSCRRVVELYELWLTRSGTTPLTVQLCPRQCGNLLNRVPDVLDLLMQCNHRLESMHLGTPCCYVAFTKMYGDASLLRSFKARLGTLYTLVPQVFPFSSCPSLVELHWVDVRFLMKPNVDIPWCQLTHLRLENVSLTEATFLFASCRELIQAHLEILENETFMHPYSPRITHYNLRHLELVIDSRNNINYLIDSLALPCVSSLYIQEVCLWYRAAPYIPVVGANHLKEMLIQSACKLQQLGLQSLNYDSASLLSVLQTPSCASLLTFKCIATSRELDIALGESLLERLTFGSSSSEVLCPDLKEICFKRYGPRKPGMLARMVASRFEREDKDGRFERFEFFHLKPFSRDVEVLLALRNKGYFIVGNLYPNSS